MRCSEARKWISRRLDGPLEGARDAALAAHLARCEACRAYADDLTRLDLSVLEVPEPSPGFTQEVMQVVDQVSRPGPVVGRRPRWFRPTAAGLGAAAAVSGFAVGLLLQQPGGDVVAPTEQTVEVVASDAIDPLAVDSIESVLVAMLSSNEE